MKIRLHQTFGAHAGRTRELDQDVITFGRLPTCDFAFDPHADLDASGSHAEIRREGAVWVLRDAGSRNGTLVAGRPVQRHELAQGDEIEFGTGGPRVRVELVQPAQGTMAATPILAASQSTPAPLSESKRYGQVTMDAAVEAAAAKARAEAIAMLETQRAPEAGALVASREQAPLSPPPVAHAPPSASTDQTLWMVAGLIALFFFLAMCLVSCVVLGFVYRQM